MTNKLFNDELGSKIFFMQVNAKYLMILMAKATKLTKAEEEKKKKAYYSKAEKKAKEIKK